MHELTPPDQLSVAICTYNRGRSICGTLDSALKAGSELREIIVVDQSANDDTALAVGPYLTDKRLRVIRTNRKGLGRSRNVALQNVTAERVFMTDDDCVLPEGYARKALDLFAARKAAGAIFVAVEAATHDARLGTVPVFLPRSERVLTRIGQLKQASGIGAGMLLRRSVWQAIGGFDPNLGPGSVFHSADDVEFTIRLLLFGFQVAESDRISVVHHGYRTTDEFRQLVRRDWFGLGGAYAKPMRSKYRREFAPVLLADLWRRSLRPLLRNLLHLRPYGVASLTSFLKGYSAGMRHPLNVEELLYRDTPDQTAG